MTGNGTDDPGRPVLELVNVTKRFAGGAEHTRAAAAPAVNGLSLHVNRGELFFLLGPSGSGKTTTLRLVAGLETPDEGQIILDGEPATRIPPHRRRTALVFQNYALFPHKTVFENVAFGLRMRRLPRPAITERVRYYLEMVELWELRERLPAQMSGGQQQRVALARALAIEPTVLLLDEPLSNLDPRLRHHMRLELRNLQRSLGITMVYVTHDQAEALSMADRIAVMHSGRLVQVGPPEELYQRPANTFVASFIGDTNLLEAELLASDGETPAPQTSADRRTHGQVRVRSTGVILPVPGSAPATGNRPVMLSIRPECLELGPGRGEPAEDGAQRFLGQGTVEDITYQGATTRYHVRLGTGSTGTVVRVDVPSRRLGSGGDSRAGTAYPIGCRVTLRTTATGMAVVSPVGAGSW